MGRSGRQAFIEQLLLLLIFARGIGKAGICLTYQAIRLFQPQGEGFWIELRQHITSRKFVTNI